MFLVAIRSDASFSIGSGHIYRCLTLAKALVQLGARVCFLCKEYPGHFGHLIEEQGFELILLTADLMFAEDAESCRKALTEKVDLLVVDHYGLDYRWESLMRPSAHAILVVDDLADRRHDCDVLLDQNLRPSGSNEYAGLVPEKTIRLLGPNYALLREEFKIALLGLRARRDQLKHLLLSFGGTDPYNLTERILAEIISSSLQLSGDVVVGQGHPQRPSIQELCSSCSWTLHVQTPQMAQLIARADLGIGAGGTTHWERCVLGLPTLVVTVAENQIATTRLLDDRGSCCWLGTEEEVGTGVITKAIQQFQGNRGRLLEMSRAARKVVPDANGADRVAMVLSAVI